MRKVLFSVVVMMSLTGAAEASTFVWKDNVNGFTFSFPDSWQVQTDDVPSTRLRIAGPIGEDFATCRVKAEKDGRLQIYPKHLMTEAVSETLDRDFWEHEVAGYERASVTDYRAPAGLGGKGDATAIKTAYVQSNGEGKMNMYGEMIGSIYADTRYIVSCASKADVFEKYAPVFASIMGSVDLDTKYHPFATGYYRDFLADPKLTLPRTKPGTIYTKNSFSFPWWGQ
jgi:hypothetical protein